MTKSRKKFDAAFEAKIALEALREDAFHGPRRMMFELNKEGRGVNRKRMQRLMRVMGEAGQRFQQA